MAINTTRRFGFGKKQEAGVSHNEGISKELIIQVHAQCLDWSSEKLSHCSYQRSGSSYPECKSEIEIYDPTGKLVIRGREFGNQTFYWPA